MLGGGRLEAAATVGHEGTVAERPHAQAARHREVLVDEHAPAPFGQRQAGNQRVRRRARRPHQRAGADGAAVGELHDPIPDAADLHARDDLDAAGRELPLRVGAELRTELGQDDRVGRDQDHPQVVLAQVRVEAQRLAHEVVDAAERLDAGEAAPRDHEGEQRLPLARRALGAGLLEVADQPVAQRDRVAQRLDRERALFDTGEPVEVGARAECQHEVIVGQLVGVGVEPVRDGHAAGLEVDGLDAAHEGVDPPEQLAERIHDRVQLEVTCRHLVQHRSEQEEVVTCDERDVERPIPMASQDLLELEGSVDPAESPSEDEDPARLRGGMGEGAHR